jgi:radical SAM protein with 4Fe4S-binding SPASM domain
MLKEEFFRNITDQLSDDILYYIFYFQGEPFLNPGFMKMIRYASDKNIYTSTSTNAHFLDDETARKTVESGLDRLIISIDGTTQEVYQQYRIGGSLEKVLQGARNVIRWKKELKSYTPYVIFQFLVVRPNEHQINDAKVLAKESGVDKILFKTAQIYDYENGSDLIPENKKFSRYTSDEKGKYSVNNKLLNHCWKLWHSSVITWDGKTVPCCFDKDAKYSMGDLTKEKFKKVWKGKSYINFRRSVLTSRKETDICTNCTEGTKVWS